MTALGLWVPARMEERYRRGARPEGSPRRGHLLAVPPVPGQHQRGTRQLKPVESYDPSHDERLLPDRAGFPARVLRGSGPAGRRTPAARIGDRAITAKELDERWRADDPAQHAEVTQTIYDGRRAALDAIIAEQLLAEAAKKKGHEPPTATSSRRSRQAREAGDRRPRSSPFYQAQHQPDAGPIARGDGAGDQPLPHRPAARRGAADADRRAAQGRPRQSACSSTRRASTVELAATDPALGRASAPVTLVEFSDFQCPFCQRVEPTLKRLRDTYGDKLRIVWKDFPADADPPAGVQGRRGGALRRRPGQVLGVPRRLFANQQALQPDDLKQHATELGLDAAAFNACLDSSKYGERVRDGVAAGHSASA